MQRQLTADFEFRLDTNVSIAGRPEWRIGRISATRCPICVADTFGGWYYERIAAIRWLKREAEVASDGLG